MRKDSISIIAIILLLCFASNNIYSQSLSNASSTVVQKSEENEKNKIVSENKNNQDSYNLEKTEGISGLSVTVVSDPMNRVGDSVYFIVTIKNNSRRDISLENVSAEIDTSADAWFVDNGEACTIGQGEPVIPAGGTLSQTCRFEPVTEPRRDTGNKSEALAPSNLFEKTPKYRIAYLLDSDLRVIINLAIKNFGSRQFYQTISIKAPEVSVFVGGVVGAMLLAMLSLIEQVIKGADTRRNLLRGALVTLATGLRGGLLAIIMLLLSRTTHGAGSPISVQVYNFAGGILIGLFSYPVASWLSSTLKVESSLRQQGLAEGVPNAKRTQAP